MAVLAIGGEDECFEPVSGQSFAYDSTSGHFSANASRNALLVTQAVSEVELFFPGGNVTEAWIHAKIYQEDQANDDFIYIKAANGDNAYRLRCESDGDWTISVWASSAWSDLATSTADADIVSNELYDLDVYLLVDGVSGEFTVYRNGVEVVTFSGDTLGDTASFGRIHFRGFTGGSADMSVSQVVVADEDTTNWVLMTHPPTGGGTNGDWTGAFTDIDETQYSAADVISTASPDDVSTFAAGDINAAWSGYSVKAFTVGMKGTIDAAGTVGSVQAAVRTVGVDHFSADITSIAADGSDHAGQAIFDNNPQTTTAWTQSQVNAVEIGAKAIAA